MTTATTDNARAQDNPSRGPGGPARPSHVPTVLDPRRPATAGAIDLVPTAPPSILTSAFEAPGGGLLGKNTSNVSTAPESGPETALAVAVDKKVQESRMRLYGLRFTSQELLGTVQTDKVAGKRYDHTSGEVVTVQDSVWHRQLGCGNRRIAEFVGVRRNKNGSCYYEGILTCGSLWPCPVCSARIRRKRAVEIQTAAVRWVAGSETKGRKPGSIVFLTITPRHTAALALLLTFGVVQSAFGSKGIFAGGSGQRLKRRLGVVGQIRATEVTVGDLNGWHPHLHLLLFIEGDLTDERLGEIEEGVYDRWASIIDREGLPSIRNDAGREHSVKAEAVRSSDDLAKYLCKVEGMDPVAEGGWGVGNEMARTDLKQGREVIDAEDKAHKTDSITDLLVFAQSHQAGLTCKDCYGGKCPEYAKAQARFLEYCKTTRGRRAIEWSPGLKALLDINEVSDEDLADEHEPDEFERLVEDLTRYDWTLIVRHRAQAKVLEAAERGGMPAVQAYLSRLASKV